MRTHRAVPYKQEGFLRLHVAADDIWKAGGFLRCHAIVGQSALEGGSLQPCAGNKQLSLYRVNFTKTKKQKHNTIFVTVGDTSLQGVY